MCDLIKTKKDFDKYTYRKNPLILFVVALSKGFPSISNILHHIVICCSPTSAL